MKIKNYACPVCGSPCKISGSHYLTPILKQAYAQCQNSFCSASWLVNIEAAKCVSPPAGWLKHKLDALGISEENAQYLAIAIKFLQEGNSSWSEEEAVHQCSNFLMKQSSELLYKHAAFYAERAMAELEGLYCSGWHISENSGQSIVVRNTNIATNEIEEHCVSLPELVQLIASKR